MVHWPCQRARLSLRGVVLAERSGMLLQTRILVADDDLVLLGFVADAFEHAGALVTRAANGVELIERLSHDVPYALVVTDISMPWMSGLQVLQTARFVGLQTPVIVITGLRDELLPAQIGALGQRVALLPKPFDVDALYALATSLLSSPELLARAP
jgi:two-component system response regulator TctD